MDLSSSSLTLSSLPQTVWNLYVGHLWRWTDYPNSWISRIAYSSRVLAIMLIMPIVVLTLLDLASYGIARSLGVIDHVKASTSDKQTIHNKIPLVRVQRAPSSSSPSSPSTSLLASTDSETLLDASEQLQQATASKSTSDFNGNSADTLPRLGISTHGLSHPDAYFTHGENSLKLSGVGVFSPAASRPPSPTITRKHLPFPDEKLTDVDEGITFRKRAPKTQDS